MILRFSPDATTVQRDAVAAALSRLGAAAAVQDGALVLEGPLSADDALALAAMPGVAEVRTADPGDTTMREAILLWAGGAAAVLGVLVLLAANLPSHVGAQADPLRTPVGLRPSWPLLPWYAAVDHAPTWAPVALLFVIGAAALFFWPSLGRKIADRAPAVHALLGAVVLLAVLGLAAWEIAR